MMKGLFNYEHAYRRYTRLLLQELYDENIMYAEIRPNFMNSNQVSNLRCDSLWMSRHTDILDYRFSRPATQLRKWTTLGSWTSS